MQANCLHSLNWKNPTIVVVTDRNDLDGQLFQTFSSGKDLIKQTPQQVEDRDQLRQLLAQNEVGDVFLPRFRNSP